MGNYRIGKERGRLVGSLAEPGAGTIVIGPSTVVAAIISRKFPVGMGGGGTGRVAVRHAVILKGNGVERKGAGENSCEPSFRDVRGASNKGRQTGGPRRSEWFGQAARMVMPCALAAAVTRSKVSAEGEAFGGSREPVASKKSAMSLSTIAEKIAVSGPGFE